MNGKLASLTLAAALTAGVLATSARATAPAPEGQPGLAAGPRWEHRGGPGERLRALGAVLNLTDDQKAQIKALFEAQRATVKPLFNDLRTARGGLRKAVGATPFAEADVRAAAQKEAAARAELTVERARLRSKIHAVLTADQQATLETLRPLLLERDPRRGAGIF